LREIVMKRLPGIAIALAITAGAQAAHAQNVATANPASLRVRYMVTDVGASAAFYTANLGFTLDMQSGPYFAAVSRGGVQLLLSPTKGPGGASQPMSDGRKPEPGGWNRLVLYTPDLQGEVDRLRKAGVHFRNGIIAGPGGREILLDDPSGNPVELFQPN
jgi:catechol 2,3-dioxygenase-like lactoylglutathione lyase family enzyme